MRKNKKGQAFDMLGKLGVGIATLAIVLTVTFLIIAQGQDQACALEVDGHCVEGNANATASYAFNATNTLAKAVDDVPGWVPLIVIASIGAVLLGLVSMFRRG